ncbi:MAG: hypothetical protein ACUVRJ_03760 [Candidatus Villigracilaceae bacterium]
MELNLGQWIVIGISAFMILGYIRGYYDNRRRAEQVLTWLHKGLEVLGPVAAGEKLPGMTTGGRLEVKHAVAPLRRAEAVYLLAPRENLFFWLFHRLQGKGDELILWLTFQSRPTYEVEVARRGDRQFEKRLKEPNRKSLVMTEGPRDLLVAISEQNGNFSEKVKSVMQRYGAAILRLSVRGNKPHLFLRANLQALQSDLAEELLTALSELAE